MTPLEKAMLILFGDKDYTTSHMDTSFWAGDALVTPNAIIEVIKQLEKIK